MTIRAFGGDMDAVEAENLVRLQSGVGGPVREHVRYSPIAAEMFYWEVLLGLRRIPGQQ